MLDDDAMQSLVALGILGLALLLLLAPFLMVRWAWKGITRYDV